MNNFSTFVGIIASLCGIAGLVVALINSKKLGKTGIAIIVTILLAVIGAGVFLSTLPTSGTHPPRTPASNATEPPIATLSASPTPTATQPVRTAQSPYPNIQGQYYGHEQTPQLAHLPDAFLLTIGHVFTNTQQNQQIFQGTFTDASWPASDNSLFNTSGTRDMNNGTVDQNGNIRFTITRPDQNGNQETITYTGTVLSGGGWQGTFSVSNGTNGTWDAGICTQC